MLKKISLLFLFCFLINCGYKPLYLNENNLENQIKSLKFKGDQKINRSIVSFLGLKEKKNANTGFELALDSKKILEVISKDKTGNPSVYRTAIIVNILLGDKGKIIKQKKISANFTYNSLQNKFELSQYQKNIEENLIDEISEKIILFLNS